MELLFAFGAGLLTLINPCVLPVLPIVLASGLQSHRHAPIALAVGMSLSFVVLGVGISALGYAVGLDVETVAQVGAVLMIGFGLILLVPQLSARFAGATAGLSSSADAQMSEIEAGGLRGQLLGGVLLGAVWSPCVGPTLGGAIALASQGESLIWATFVMLFFAFGVSAIILALGYGARATLLRRQATMRRIAQVSRPIMGAVFVFVGAAILLRWHHLAEGWLVQNLPAWLNDFSVSL